VSIASELYGGEDEVFRVLLGDRTRRGTGWLYVQDQGKGVVSFVGSAKVPEGRPHPFRYGSGRSHQFVLGEVILRPALVVATDTLEGMGLAGLATSHHDVRAMLDKGEILLTSKAAEASLRRAGVL
jgi:hypothetical protein